MLRCFMTHYGHMSWWTCRDSVAPEAAETAAGHIYFLLICFGCCSAAALLWSRVNSQLLCSHAFGLRQLIFIYTYFQLNIIKLTLRARANLRSLGEHFACRIFSPTFSKPSRYRFQTRPNPTQSSPVPLNQLFLL